MNFIGMSITRYLKIKKRRVFTVISYNLYKKLDF